MKIKKNPVPKKKVYTFLCESRKKN